MMTLYMLTEYGDILGMRALRIFGLSYILESM